MISIGKSKVVKAGSSVAIQNGGGGGGETYDDTAVKADIAANTSEIAVNKGDITSINAEVVNIKEIPILKSKIKESISLHDIYHIKNWSPTYSYTTSKSWRFSNSSNNGKSTVVRAPAGFDEDRLDFSLDRGKERLSNIFIEFSVKKIDSNASISDKISILSSNSVSNMFNSKNISTIADYQLLGTTSEDQFPTNYYKNYKNISYVLKKNPDYIQDINTKLQNAEIGDSVDFSIIIKDAAAGAFSLYLSGIKGVDVIINDLYFEVDRSGSFTSNVDYDIIKGTQTITPINNGKIMTGMLSVDLFNAERELQNSEKSYSSLSIYDKSEYTFSKEKGGILINKFNHSDYDFYDDNLNNKTDSVINGYFMYSACPVRSSEIADFNKQRIDESIFSITEGEYGGSYYNIGQITKNLYDSSTVYNHVSAQNHRVKLNEMNVRIYGTLEISAVSPASEITFLRVAQCYVEEGMTEDYTMYKVLKPAYTPFYDVSNPLQNGPVTINIDFTNEKFRYLIGPLVKYPIIIGIDIPHEKQVRVKANLKIEVL